MAKKKQAGKLRQQAQRVGKRLGVKVSGGQKVETGAILVRQRGTLFHAGEGVGVGRDYSLYALRTGVVGFKKKQGASFVVVS